MIRNWFSRRNRWAGWWGAGADGSLGRRGERLAARYLKRRGYRIIDRNIRVGRDEVDLLALAPGGACLVIVEVKTRCDDAVAPETQVGRKKQHHLSRIAAHLQRQRRFASMRFRFDVIAIVWPKAGEPVVRHHEAAFDATV